MVKLIFDKYFCDINKKTAKIGQIFDQSCNKLLKLIVSED